MAVVDQGGNNFRRQKRTRRPITHKVRFYVDYVEATLRTGSLILFVSKIKPPASSASLKWYKTRVGCIAGGGLHVPSRGGDSHCRVSHLKGTIVRGITLCCTRWNFPPSLQSVSSVGSMRPACFCNISGCLQPRGHTCCVPAF